jgi:L-iditol 2-dehydrogenase
MLTMQYKGGIMARRMWQTVLVEPGRFVREETARPEPKPGEVLIRVARVGVCGSDISAFHGRHPYISCPIVLGHEFSGEVAARGSDEGPAPGTRVTVIPHLGCGTCNACANATYNLCDSLRVIGCQAPGAHAEYVTVPATMALPIPEALSWEDAAMVEPAAVAFHAARRAGIGTGDRVLVVGAGPIGIFTMQCAKALGAETVSIADLDAVRLELARALGADDTIHTLASPLADGVARLGSRPNVYADCVGGSGEVLDGLLAVAPRGSRILAVGVLKSDYRIPHLTDLVEHELAVIGTSMYVRRDYQDAIAALTEGRLRTAGMMTHTFTLADVATAFDMIECGEEPYFKVMFSA